MFRRFIKNIRQQPKATRDKIAISIAGGFTACIVAIWLYHMPSRLASITESADDNESPPAFSQFFNEIGDQFSTVKEAISENSEDEAGSEEVAAELSYDQFKKVGENIATSSVASSTTPTSTSPLVASSTIIAPATTTKSIRIIASTPSASSSGAESE